jgi:hypothetical protein
MDKATYALMSGIALLAAAIGFFILPGLLDYDAFVPVIVGISLLGAAIISFIAGYSALGE